MTFAEPLEELVRLGVWGPRYPAPGIVSQRFGVRGKPGKLALSGRQVVQ